jgi:hypothetical protein
MFGFRGFATKMHSTLENIYEFTQYKALQYPDIV